MLLDSEAFMARLMPQLQDCATAEIPKRQRLEHRPSLKTLMAGTDSRPTRNEQWHGPISSMDIHSPRSAGPPACTRPRSVAASETTSWYKM
jgi:hypothetical protein